MGISDFFRKVRTLLEGEQLEDEVYTDEVKPERIRPEGESRQSNAAARLAERMADEYIDPNAPEEDDDLYEEPADRFYRMPDSYSDNEFATDDSYDNGFDDEVSEEEPEEIYAPARTENMRESIPVAVTADGSAQAQPLPNRTEVTLRQIERLSKQLDPETLRAYQMRLIKLKQDTGAVSALTALRILHEYVDDDADDADADTKSFPDLSAR